MNLNDLIKLMETIRNTGIPTLSLAWLLILLLKSLPTILNAFLSLLKSSQEKKNKAKVDINSVEALLKDVALDQKNRNDFRCLTGIDIHPDKIEALKALRKQSKGNYDWPQIKNARSFIQVVNNKCRIVISKSDKYMDLLTKGIFNVGAGLFTILFFTSAVLFLLDNTKAINNFGLLLFSVMCIIATLLLKQYVRRDIICAELIKKNMRD